MAHECSTASSSHLENANNEDLSVESQLLLEREIFRTTLSSYLNQFQEVLHNTCQAYEAQIQQLNDRNVVRSSVYSLHGKISGIQECLTDRMDRLLEKNSTLATTLDLMQMENTAADMRAHSLLVECSEKMEETVSQKMDTIIKGLMDARMSELLKSAEDSSGGSSGSGVVSLLTASHPFAMEARHKETVPESCVLVPSVDDKEGQERDPATEMEEVWAQLKEKCAVHLPLCQNPTNPQSLRMAVDVISKLEKVLDKDNEIITLQNSLCKANEELLNCRAELEKVKTENTQLEATFFEGYVPRKHSATPHDKSSEDPFRLGLIKQESAPSVPKKIPYSKTVSPRTIKKALEKLALARQSAESLAHSKDLRKESITGGVNAEGQKNSTDDTAEVCGQQKPGGSLPISFYPRLSLPELSSAPVEQRAWSGGMVVQAPVVPGDELFVQMDISIAGEPAGHIVLKLYRDEVREITDMFFRLCVRYACSFRGGDIFHVVPGCAVWFRPAKDQSPNGGSCPETVPRFPKYTKGSQRTYRAGQLTASAGIWPWFTIPMGPDRTMDSASVVIGEVVEGMDIVEMIEVCGSDSGQPSCAIMITHCKRVRY